MLRRFLAPLFAAILSVSVLQSATVRAAPLLDIMVLVDGSGSVSNPDYETQRAAVQNLFDSFTIGAADAKFGLVQFSTGATLLSGLSDNAAALQNTLATMTQPFGQTNHGDAFQLANTELSTNGRAGARQAVIILTDGVANEPVGPGINPLSHAIGAADDLKANGIEIFGVGIGGAIAIGDIEDYASPPTEDYAFHVSDHDSLQSALDIIIADLQATDGELSETQVSAPAPLALFGLGLGVLALYRRRIAAA